MRATGCICFLVILGVSASPTVLQTSDRTPMRGNLNHYNKRSGVSFFVMRHRLPRWRCPNALLKHSIGHKLCRRFYYKAAFKRARPPEYPIRILPTEYVFLNIYHFSSVSGFWRCPCLVGQPVSELEHSVSRSTWHNA